MVEPTTLALRAALAAADAVPHWQPIETAPKLGSPILLFTSYGLIYCGQWRHGLLGEPQQSVVAWRCSSSGRFADPTHWMPLPAPPNAAAQEPYSYGTGPEPLKPAETPVAAAPNAE